ncbi:MAG TPA: methyl-accepting chemotaxis protein, partial [Afipia sp.]
RIVANDKAALGDGVNQMQVAYSDMTAADDGLRKFQFTEAHAGFLAAQSTYATFRAIGIAGIVFGLAAALFSYLMLSRAITRPLADALEHFDEIAAGNLRRPVAVTSHDEMGLLLSGIAKMQHSLIDTVRSVRGGSESIATATRQIAAGNLDLSSRTEEQASALQETASSMEELTSTVKHNADNARQASALAANASSIANRGNAVVGQVIGTMGEINHSSTKIADIISIIEGIAFQTNILALNAAVEAARAGEEGRGFAVVAAEVRSLAQRSSSAAKEIKELIDTSVERVQSGSTLVEEAGRTMTEIIDAVRRVSDIMGEIAVASEEQSNGIDQVARAVTQMDEATQQNAALVEEAAAAAQSLEDQAGKLRAAVSVFQLEEAGRPSGTPMLRGGSPHEGRLPALVLE